MPYRIPRAIRGSLSYPLKLENHGNHKACERSAGTDVRMGSDGVAHPVV